MVLFRKGLDYTIHTSDADPNGRFVIIDLEIQSTRLTIANVYGPNIDDACFFERLIQRIELLPNDNRIIAGDFNLVLDVELDKKGGNNTTHFSSQRIVKTYMEETDLTDVLRYMHKDKHIFTWFRRTPSFIACRLDFFLISNSLLHLVHDTGAKCGYLSDHSRIYLNIKLSKAVRGPGFWKLNTSLLNDREYCDLIKNNIRDTVNNNYGIEPMLLWETIKCMIRGASVKYSSQKKKKQKEHIIKLEEEINRLEQEYINNPQSDRIQSELGKHKNELDIELGIIAKGHIIRSKVKDFELDEKSNSYFLNLEKRNYNRKHITMLRNSSGTTIVSDPSQILAMETDFYRNLYKSSDSVSKQSMEKFVQEHIHNLSSLNETENNDLTKVITINEIQNAIKLMGKGKTPGIDGLPIEFYIVFWLEIKMYLLNSINESYEKGFLSITQKQGVITLLPKPNKDLLLLKNWRPLTLMNADYKIITSCLAHRIKKYLNKLISPEQSGFMSNRYIGENIFKITSLVDCHHRESKDGMLVLLDYEKAFDTVEWDFINFVLHKMNFPLYIIKWVNIIYNKRNTSFIINNGWKGESIMINRGIKQGCPLSPYLFLLAIELLTKAIKNSNDIKGLSIGQFYSKLSLFADDTCLTLQYDEKSLKTAFSILTNFQAASGLKLNIDKTEILKIGPISRTGETLCPEFNICWKNNFVRLLGVYICNDVLDIYEKNYVNKCDISNSVVNIWRQRNLTLYGKTLVVKSFILSQWMYPLTVLPVLGFDLDKTLNNILFSFLWNSKPDKIKRKTICSDFKQGGIRFPNISHYLRSTKLSWWKRVFSSDELCHIVTYFFAPLKCLNKDVLHCNLSKDDLHYYVQKNTHTIVYEMLYYLYEGRYMKWNCTTNFKDEIIWLNSCIRINNMPIINNKCIQRGVLKVSDLMIDGIMFVTFDEFVLKYGNVINFMEFNSIVSAINAGIRVANASNAQLLYNPLNTDMLISCKKPQKYAYNYMCNLNADNILSDLCVKWNNVLMPFQDMNEPLLSKHFINIGKITVSVRHRNFIYKYLHMKLYLNPVLQTMNIKDTDKCSFCDINVESINHLFYDCRYSMELWAYIKMFCYNRFKYELDVSNPTILMPSVSFSPVIQLIMFVTIYYIYTCRIQSVRPVKTLLVRQIHMIEAMELEISKANNKYHVHKNKWKL